MKILLWAAAAYVGIGIYRCMKSSDGVSNAVIPGCPTVVGAGTDYPNGMPANCAPGPCSNRTIECILKWPMWNATSCSTHF